MSEEIFAGLVERIENDKVIIKLENGVEISWPIEKMSKDATVGSKINLTLSVSSEEDRREELAKNFLNKVLEK